MPDGTFIGLDVHKATISVAVAPRWPSRKERGVAMCATGERSRTVQNTSAGGTKLKARRKATAWDQDYFKASITRTAQ